MSDLLEQFLTLVGKSTDHQQLLATAVQERDPALHARAIEEMGSWEALLAAAVLSLQEHAANAAVQAELDRLAAERKQDIPSLEREKDPQADEPLFALTDNGTLFTLKGTALPLSPAPTTFTLPEGKGTLAQLKHLGPLTNLTILSQRGYYFGLMESVIPSMSSLESARTAASWLELEDDDQIFTVFARHQFIEGTKRMYHATQHGKGKATLLEDFSHLSDRKGREAFLLKGDDIPVSVMIGDEWGGMFCASAQGQGIHFQTEKIRSMGRKSVGVNLMKLSGSHDALVSAFLTNDIHEFVVITKQGYGKRLPMNEFRQQGRGGSGMQVLRLNTDDLVVAVVPVDAQSDVAITTSTGDVYRLPAITFPTMGRSAKGKHILELDDDVHITGMYVLPCAGTFGSQTSSEESTPSEEQTPSEGSAPSEEVSPSEDETENVQEQESVGQD